jgi:predicted enzyme related to lactoylglutathione lyase
MKIDHVTIAGSDLGVMQEAFEELGMKTDYGGPHSNGVTHMALLGFDDGSYIELISTLKPGPSPVWGKHITENGGPCAWAIQVEDIEAELARVKKLGISAVGPSDYSRARPDGVLVEWQLGFIGDKPPGATFPFLIKDKTPREYRVRPSVSVSRKNGDTGSSRLTGLDKVILGVSDLEKEIKLFQTVYDWSEPETSSDSLDGATIAEFPNTPVVLATPLDGGWLKNRLDKFGDSPCAFLIGTEDLQETKKKYDLKSEHKWLLRNKVSWIPPERLDISMLGFIQKTQIT